MKINKTESFTNMKWYISLIFVYYFVDLTAGQGPIGPTIERPCPSLNLDCIRNYFEKHGKCVKQVGYSHVPEVIKRAQSVGYLSRLNVTATLYNVEYKNLDGKIEDFFVNKESGKVILVINFQNIKIKSNEAIFRFHRRAKEPVLTRGKYFSEFGPIIVTGLIPDKDYLRLKDSISYPFLTEPKARESYFSPSLFRSKDETVRKVAADFDKFTTIRLKEFMTTEASFYFATFVQYTICDFGLKLL